MTSFKTKLALHDELEARRRQGADPLVEIQRFRKRVERLEDRMTTIESQLRRVAELLEDAV